MRVSICLILSLLVMVLCGCDQSAENPTEASQINTTVCTETSMTTTEHQTTKETTESTEPTSQESTLPPSTDPSDVQVRDPSLPVWYSDDGKKSNSDEQEEIYYMDDIPPTQWYVTIDGVQDLYQIRMTANGLAIDGTGMEEPYLVPETKQLTSYQLAGANGWAAYVYSDTEIMQIDLITGEVTALVNPCRVFDVWLCEGGLYYAVEWGGESERLINLYRRTPGATTLYPYLTNTFSATSLFAIQHPESSHSDIFWTQLNPEMWEVLETELADEDSPYKASHKACWESSDIRVDPEGVEALKAFCLQLQQDTGIPALIKVRYDLETMLRGLEKTPIFLEP